MEEGQTLRERSFARTAVVSLAGLAIAAVILFAVLNVDLLERWNSDLGTFLRSKPLSLPFWFLIAFAAGVITSLTPCVYPVVPLAVTYLGARGATSRIRAFSLAAAYVAGMVLCYTALGAAAGLAGTAFGTATQKWWVYAAVATIVLLFGLSMLGLFSIRLPSSIMSLAGKGSGPGYRGALLMGATSGLVTAPCTAPVLGTLLSLVSSKSAALGSVLLAVFGLGMGMLFLVVGTYSGVLASMPKSGRWMNLVKTVLGVAILLVSAYYFYQAWLKLPFSLSRAGASQAQRSELSGKGRTAKAPPGAAEAETKGRPAPFSIVDIRRKQDLARTGARRFIWSSLPSGVRASPSCAASNSRRACGEELPGDHTGDEGSPGRGEAQVLRRVAAARGASPGTRTGRSRRPTGSAPFPVTSSSDPTARSSSKGAIFPRGSSTTARG